MIYVIPHNVVSKWFLNHLHFMKWFKSVFGISEKKIIVKSGCWTSFIMVFHKNVFWKQFCFIFETKITLKITLTSLFKAIFQEHVLWQQCCFIFATKIHFEITFLEFFPRKCALEAALFHLCNKNHFEIIWKSLWNHVFVIFQGKCALEAVLLHVWN